MVLNTLLNQLCLDDYAKRAYIAGAIYNSAGAMYNFAGLYIWAMHNFARLYIYRGYVQFRWGYVQFRCIHNIKELMTDPARRNLF